MNDIERNELIDYLREAIQHETDVITQEQIITTFDKESERRKPILAEKQSVERPQMVSLSQDSYVLPVMGWIIFLSGAFMLLLEFQYGITSFIVLSILVLLLGVFLLSIWHKKKKSIEEENQRRQEQYDKRTAEIEAQYKLAREKYDSSMLAWNDSNVKMHAFFEEPLQKSRRILSQIYEQGKIYPKYHNLPALTSICEYFITGRCDELTGPHGAYNLYEDEVRKDTVISQMNTIISNLEAIKMNQFMLYEQVRDIQDTTQRIGIELRQIKGYTIAMTEMTALNAYYAALQERNTEFLAIHHMLT